MSEGSSDRTASPHHPPSTSHPPPSLRVPADPQHSPSSRGTHNSVDQSKSRASTRQSHMPSSTQSNWSSTSGMSQSTTTSSLRPYFYPTSGYPVSSSILQQSYPGSGYPVSYLHHSYGYPANNFPCCEVPRVADLGSHLLYPSSEFPGGGTFPGEIEQDDGSAPFINGLESDLSAPFGGEYGGFPDGQISSLPSSDNVYKSGLYNSQYNGGYPI